LEPHFYLDAVGVVPGERRRGIASDLLDSVLAMCDADHVAAYLENSDQANTNFYARHGFEEIGPLPMPNGGPDVVAMWREPESARCQLSAANDRRS
jgi:ribosomal protein S18 acetylase RimI-like enzyme